MFEKECGNLRVSQLYGCKSVLCPLLTGDFKQAFLTSMSRLLFHK